MSKAFGSRYSIENSEEAKEYFEFVKDLLDSDVVNEMKNFRHHYSTTCYQHCINVSYYNYLVCRKLGLNSRSAARAGIIGEKVADRELMTKLDFYELGLSGRPDSSRLRQLVCEKLSLPKKLTANALLEVVNTMLDKESLQALIEELTSENNKDKENSVG